VYAVELRIGSRTTSLALQHEDASTVLTKMLFCRFASRWKKGDPTGRARSRMEARRCYPLVDTLVQLKSSFFSFFSRRTRQESSLSKRKGH
jgi:hypothetical protein